MSEEVYLSRQYPLSCVESFMKLGRPYVDSISRSVDRLNLLESSVMALETLQILPDRAISELTIKSPLNCIKFYTHHISRLYAQLYLHWVDNPLRLHCDDNCWLRTRACVLYVNIWKGLK